uniref:Uncharacterized protein n=1 Tax=Peronospora matthiolae TaxID=2874970 RepID=A0AAV1UWP7_9STRA
MCCYACGIPANYPSQRSSAAGVSIVHASETSTVYGTVNDADLSIKF